MDTALFHSHERCEQSLDTVSDGDLILAPNSWLGPRRAEGKWVTVKKCLMHCCGDLTPWTGFSVNSRDLLKTERHITFIGCPQKRIHKQFLLAQTMFLSIQI